MKRVFRPGLAGFWRARRFRAEGLCYNAAIVRINWFNIRRHALYRKYAYAFATVDCAYKDKCGEYHRVVSRKYVLMLDFDNCATLAAKVYVDRDDPSRYEVEIFRRF